MSTPIRRLWSASCCAQERVALVGRFARLYSAPLIGRPILQKEHVAGRASVMPTHNFPDGQLVQLAPPREGPPLKIQRKYSGGGAPEQSNWLPKPDK